jgi:hypothetical protein
MGVRRLGSTVLGTALPVAVAVAALPLRAELPSAGDAVAVALVGVVALTGTLGVRATPVLAAVSAATAFAVLWAEPYGSIEIRHPGDRVSALLVLVVGSILGLRSRRGRRWFVRHRPLRLRGRRDPVAAAHLQTVGRVAGEIAEGDTAGMVVLDVARSLVEVLGLRDCRFEAAPLAAASTPRLLHTGELEYRGMRWTAAMIGLPADGFTIPVVARGRTEGRYVCLPRRPYRVSDETVAVALTLVDQAASALLLEAVA